MECRESEDGALSEVSAPSRSRLRFIESIPKGRPSKACARRATCETPIPRAPLRSARTNAVPPKYHAEVPPAGTLCQVREQKRGAERQQSPSQHEEGQREENQEGDRCVEKRMARIREVQATRTAAQTRRPPAH